LLTIADVSGTVAQIGSAVSNFKPGDRVFAYADSFLSGDDDHAAFQTYTVAKAVSASHLPENISFQEGALMPMSAGTSAIALFDVLGLPKPAAGLSSLPPITQPLSILVWGGASSVGSMTIQLARLAGFTVFATASNHHDEYLRGLGAAKVIDYRSEGVVDDLVSAAKLASKPIGYAVDAIAEEKTLEAVIQVLLKSGKPADGIRKVAHVLPWPESLSAPKEIETQMVSGEDIWGRRRDLLTWGFHEFLPSALSKKIVVPSPGIEVIDGGLQGLQAAMNQLKEGVSGKKLIVEVV
jgi:hypothetical protein